MVDSRQKGARAENSAKGVLKKHTGLNWQRTPGSGALNVQHKLKGDLYIPNEKNKFCTEVKHYKADHLTSKILTDKKPQLLEWWEQTERQANQTQRDPLLIFKFDRSKWFIAYTTHAFNNATPSYAKGGYRYITFWYDEENHPVYIAKLEDFLTQETHIKWIL